MGTTPEPATGPTPGPAADLIPEPVTDPAADPVPEPFPGPLPEPSLVPTDQQQIAKLRNQVKFLTRLLEAIPDSICYEAPDGMLLGCNQAHTPDGPPWPETLKAPIADDDGALLGWLRLSRDMSAQARIEEQLRTSIENFEVFFATMDDMIFITNEAGQVISTNRAVTEKLGFSPAEMVSMHILDFNPPGQRAEAEQIFAEMFAGKRSTCPLPLVRKEGTLLPAETRVWFGSWNNQRCMFGVAKDLSKEQESLQKFNKIFDLNPALMAISTMSDRTFIEVNRTFITTLGYHRDEVIGRTARELDLFVDQATHDKITRQLIIHGSISNQELLVRKKDGTILNGLFSGEIIESQGQRFLLTVMADVTSSIQAQLSLRHQSELQQILMKISTEYINLPLEIAGQAINQSLHDIGEFVQADRAYIFDYDFAGHTCSNSYEWCREGISPQIANLQQVPLAALQNWVSTHRQGKMMLIPDVLALPEKDGIRQVLEPQGVRSLITLPMMDEAECIGFVGFDSVTMLKAYTETEITLLAIYSKMLVNLRIREEQENRLKLAKVAAEEASQAKSRFLATMSHEIRTPMNGMLGFLQLLEHHETDPQHLIYITKIRDSAQTLLTIVNDVLDVSRIEAGKLALEHIPFDLPAVVTTTCQSFLIRAEEKGIAFELAIAPDVPHLVTGDPVRLRQILINLISNAVKFTNSGAVYCHVVIREGETGPCHVLFKIRDTGIGMSAETVSRLFQPFMQADSSLTRKYGGSGLGLSITHHLITMLGGQIAVESQPGQGSQFIVELPFAVGDQGFQAPASGPRHMEERLRGARVLLVEDNEINREIAREMLENAGVQVDIASNGQEAVEAVRQQAFDVVLMDIQMPEMDGYEATREIRRDDSRQNLPIIAMTAGVMTSERERASAAGMNDYITKPINGDELRQIIARWLEPFHRNAADAAP